MILYVMEHIGLLSHMTTLRLHKHRNEAAALIGVNFEKKEPLYTNLSRSGLFNHVISYPVGANNLNSKKEIDDYFDKSYLSLLKNAKIEFADISFAYYAFDGFPHFATFLHSRGVECINVETMSEYIRSFTKSRHDNHVAAGNCSAAFADLVKNMATMTEEFVPINKVIVFPETKKIKQNNYVERYDFFGNALKIAEEDKRKLVECFGLEQDLIDNLTSKVLSIVLPVSNPFMKGAYEANAVLGDFLYSEKKFELMYAILSDYFYDSRYTLVFKPHPNATVDFNVFDKNGAIRIDSILPIEFISFLPNIKIAQTLTTFSTAAGKINHLTDKRIRGGNNFYAWYHFLDRLYVIFKSIYECLPHGKIQCYGVPKHIYEQMTEHCIGSTHKKLFHIRIFDSKFKFDSDSCYIINDSLSVLEAEPALNRHLFLGALKNAPDKCVIFFTNSIFMYSFADIDNKDLLDNVLPIAIKRNVITDNPLDEPGEKIIYAFAKDSAIRESLSRINFTRDLPFSGIRLVVEPITEDRIKAEQRRCYEFAVGRAALEKVNILSGQSLERLGYQQSSLNADEVNNKINEMAAIIRNQDVALKEARHRIHSYESFVAWKLLKPLHIVYRVIKNLRNK